MKKHSPVLHFLFLLLAFVLLAGCGTKEKDVAVQDMQYVRGSVDSTQTVRVSTFAGGNWKNFADGMGIDAKFYSPEGIAIDAAGNFYVTDSGNHRIRKITPEGKVSTLAGGEQGFVDGVGGEAKFYRPKGIVSDAAGNLYIADTGNHRIRKITADGNVSTIAGGEKGFANGVGSEARFNAPIGIAMDAAGNLYTADSGNSRIRKITPEGEVSTFAGSWRGFADGVGGTARFYYPEGIAIDAAGNLYVTDTANGRIRKITPAGEVSTLASGKWGFPDGVGRAVAPDNPTGIAVDAAGNLYVTGSGNHRIRKITPAGEISTLAGGDSGFADGMGGDAGFRFPDGIAIDAAGNFYVADSGNHRIRKITPEGEVSTIAGSKQGFADGVGGDAEFDAPVGVAMDSTGNLYVADARNHRIRKITPEGEVSTVAGGGEKFAGGGRGFSGEDSGFADGVGRDAKFYEPSDIAMDAVGNLYVADSYNHRIRKITPEGKVSTFAGSGKGFVEGIGSDAKFCLPTAVVSDAEGNLYVTDSLNNRIRKITPEGEVSTFAGGEQGFADGIGSDALFNFPQGIASDATGNFYVTDSGNHRIRKITPAGKVSTIAGGEEGFADGVGSEARFAVPGGVASDAAGNLYIADRKNHRIRKITPTGKVSTLAGGGLISGGFVDSIGLEARFNKPSGIVSDAAGNLYVTDSGNHRIRKLVFVTGPPYRSMVSTLAGGEWGFVDGVGSGSMISTFADGVGGEAKFYFPSGIVSDAAGNLYVADRKNHRIRKITSAGKVSTIAGGEKGFADGVGSNARFDEPSAVASDAAGNLYVIDSRNYRIRKITPEGEVSTLAGGKQGFADGIGGDAKFYFPSGIETDAAGNLYVADSGNGRIRKITPEGEVSTFAGGEQGFADGIGRDAKFRSPSDIASDAAGNLYVADSGNHRIRKITPEGKVSTLAGGEKGFADGVGSNAQFHDFSGIAIDAAGNLYVTDHYSTNRFNNDRIRKITSAGEVSTLAGGESGDNLLFVGGGRGFADGVGNDARFKHPDGIAVDAAGNLYVADTSNHQIRKIEIHHP